MSLKNPYMIIMQRQTSLPSNWFESNWVFTDQRLENSQVTDWPYVDCCQRRNPCLDVKEWMERKKFQLLCAVEWAPNSVALQRFIFASRLVGPDQGIPGNVFCSAYINLTVFNWWLVWARKSKIASFTFMGLLGSSVFTFSFSSNSQCFLEK